MVDMIHNEDESQSYIRILEGGHFISYYGLALVTKISAVLILSIKLIIRLQEVYVFGMEANSSDYVACSQIIVQ